MVRCVVFCLLASSCQSFLAAISIINSWLINSIEMFITFYINCIKTPRTLSWGAREEQYYFLWGDGGVLDQSSGPCCAKFYCTEFSSCFALWMTDVCRTKMPFLSVNHSAFWKMTSSRVSLKGWFGAGSSFGLLIRQSFRRPVAVL